MIYHDIYIYINIYVHICMNRCILGEINEKTYILAKSPKVHKGGGSTPPPIGGYISKFGISFPWVHFQVQFLCFRGCRFNFAMGIFWLRRVSNVIPSSGVLSELNLRDVFLNPKIHCSS